MNPISIRFTTLWQNIQFITVIFCNFALSVYKCAHFYENPSVSPQILSDIR